MNPRTVRRGKAATDGQQVEGLLGWYSALGGLAGHVDLDQHVQLPVPGVQPGVQLPGEIRESRVCRQLM